MELGTSNTCKRIRCVHLFIADGRPRCDCGRMHEGLFSCREFDAFAARLEAYP